MDRDSQAGAPQVLPQGGRGSSPGDTAPLVEDDEQSRAAAAEPGYGRARCPVCRHTTFDEQQIDTGWCLWCKAFTWVGHDGVDRRGASPIVNAPQLVYAGAMWRHATCGGLNEGELYAYRANDGVWCLSVEPIYDPLATNQSPPRCCECDGRVYVLDMISGYYALVVAPVERVGSAERVERTALPLPFTDTVPPGETSSQP